MGFQRLRGLRDIPGATGKHNRAMLGLASYAILVWCVRQVEEVIRAAPRDILKQLRNAAQTINGLLVIGFSNAAQSSVTYAEYTAKIAVMPIEELLFLGLAFHGPKKAINKLTGNLPLLR
jgi:hypothetical protein